MEKQKKPMILMASHIPLLGRVFDKSEGDVLEIGTGYFSTLYLHWLCQLSGRKLYSYESIPHWYQRSKRYESDFHKIEFVEDWDKAPIYDKHWGMVFIDHKPSKRRGTEAIKIANNADYVVLHDTEPEAAPGYGYDEAFKHFKYRYDYKKLIPNTSVLSNFKDLKNID